MNVSRRLDAIPCRTRPPRSWHSRRPWTSESSSDARSEAIMTPSRRSSTLPSRGWTRPPASSSGTQSSRDAIQEALIRAWRDLSGLRDPDRFEAWLHRLTVNACLDLAAGGRDRDSKARHRPGHRARHRPGVVARRHRDRVRSISAAVGLQLAGPADRHLLAGGRDGAVRGTVAPRGPRTVPTDRDAATSRDERFYFDWSPDSRSLIGYPSEAIGHPVVINTIDGTWRALDPVIDATTFPRSQGWQRLAVN